MLLLLYSFINPRKFSINLGHLYAHFVNCLDAYNVQDYDFSLFPNVKGTYLTCVRIMHNSLRRRLFINPEK